MLYKYLVENHLEDKKNKVVLRYQERDYTYEAINHLVAGTRKYFQEKGIKKGDRVVIVSKNSLEEVIAILTTISMGATFVPLPFDIARKRLEYVIEDCQPAAILMDENRCEEDCIKNLEIPVILMSELQKIKVESEEVRPHISEEEIAYIIYTSGSTSNPKGVVARQKQVLFAANAINSVIKNNENDIVLCRIPLSFDYGLYQMLMTFLVGAELVLIDEKEVVQQIPFLLKKYKVTGFPVVPALLNVLIKSRLLERIEIPSLRYITSTGDALPVYSIEKIEEMMPHVEVVPMYGLTECKRVSIMPLGNREKKRLGSCGLPLPGTRVELLNKKDGIGELVVIGPNVMSGYWGDEKETQRYFSFTNEERILRTGDLFRMDEDGYLYFIGRTKSFIKNNGYRINVLELETLLYSHEDIKEVAVIGIENSDVGEEIACVIYADEEADKKKIMEESSRAIGGIKIKKYIFSNDPLPKNSNGKVDRKHIKQKVEEKIWV